MWYCCLGTICITVLNSGTPPCVRTVCQEHSACILLYGAVLLTDGTYTWRCTGIQYRNADGTKTTVPHEDWRASLSITIADTSAYDTSGFGGSLYIYYTWKVDWEGDPPVMYENEYDINYDGLTALGFDKDDMTRIEGIRYDESSERYWTC